jgi:hypothetical protein
MLLSVAEVYRCFSNDDAGSKRLETSVNFFILAAVRT